VVPLEDLCTPSPEVLTQVVAVRASFVRRRRQVPVPNGITRQEHPARDLANVVDSSRCRSPRIGIVKREELLRRWRPRQSHGTREDEPVTATGEIVPHNLPDIVDSGTDREGGTRKIIVVKLRSWIKNESMVRSRNMPKAWCV